MWYSIPHMWKVCTTNVVYYTTFVVYYTTYVNSSGFPILLKSYIYVKFRLELRLVEIRKLFPGCADQTE